MKHFAILAAAFIALAPAAALARECSKQTANVCEQGYTWDQTAQACVQVVTG